MKTEKEKSAAELDNDVMLPEELMVILPWPIEAVIQLCEEIQDDQKQGFY